MSTYPTPQALGLAVPRCYRAEPYQAGFQHALRGGQLRVSAHLRLSFRAGFRAGKLYLRELRRARGILTFPLLGRIRLRVTP